MSALLEEGPAFQQVGDADARWQRPGNDPVVTW
jgi:hypothetical protein